MMIDNSAFFERIGIDDCKLEVGKSTDLSGSNCAAPIMPYRHCPMMDIVRIESSAITFGEPIIGDRCLVRPQTYEHSHYRVLPSKALMETLTELTFNEKDIIR